MYSINKRTINYLQLIETPFIQYFLTADSHFVAAAQKHIVLQIRYVQPFVYTQRVNNWKLNKQTNFDDGLWRIFSKPLFHLSTVL